MSSTTPSGLQLPNSLNLPPHLSAHKYFMVCTLTVAAWDALVLSPRSWRLLRSPGWPLFKIIYNFLRLFMPAEFIVVGELSTPSVMIGPLNQAAQPLHSLPRVGTPMSGLSLIFFPQIFMLQFNRLVRRFTFSNPSALRSFWLQLLVRLSFLQLLEAAH